MRFLAILILTLSSRLAFADTKPNETAKAVVNKSLQEDQSQSSEDEAPSTDGLPTVESLMLKKMDIVEKVEKIEKIEAVVDGSNKVVSPKTGEVDKNAYLPLHDEDGKQLQAIPPFSLNPEQH